MKVLPATIYPKTETEIQPRYSKCCKQFLDNLKITTVKVSTKPKRKAPPNIIGNLSGSKNQEILHTTSCKKALKLNTPIPPPIPSTSTSNKENNQPLPSNLSPSEDEMGITADESLCCVCQRNMPVALQSVYIIESVHWAQCDRCGHWIHLKYCCKTMCLKRGSEILRPHCEET